MLTIPDIVDSETEALIDHLAAPLLPAQRSAFRHAAREALAHVPVRGPGAVFRAVSVLQRQFFDAPDLRGSRQIPYARSGKLANRPPIGRNWTRRVG